MPGFERLFEREGRDFARWHAAVRRLAELPRDDWRLGAPFLFCAALQALALVFALRFQRTHPVQPVNAHA